MNGCDEMVSLGLGAITGGAITLLIALAKFDWVERRFHSDGLCSGGWTAIWLGCLLFAKGI